jgi:methylated-DNA-[protein]-cysteine S-methyltransferase
MGQTWWMPSDGDTGAIVRTIAGPWGPLHIAATMRGIVAIESATTDDAFAVVVARRLDAPVVSEWMIGPDDPRRILLDRATDVIADLVAGRPPRGAIPPVDLDDRPAWDRRVLGEVHAIGWGETASYGEIARRIGAPRAARAVGGALGRNPISLLVPCHRVIAADGTIGGYGGDAWGSREAALERKRTLLHREGVTVESRDRPRDD